MPPAAPTTLPPGPILRLEAVSKRFDGAAGLEDVSLDVPAARTTVLLGPSGSGKTTALRLMLGLVRPDAGRVLWREAELDGEELRRARTQMGYVVQDGGLFPHLTALENVSLVARTLALARGAHPRARGGARRAGAPHGERPSPATPARSRAARSSGWRSCAR